jgi:hypothetical protein
VALSCLPVTSSASRILAPPSRRARLTAGQTRLSVSEQFPFRTIRQLCVAKQIADDVCGKHSTFEVIAGQELDDLVRSNEDMGSDYIENDFMSPTTEEIRNARPLVAVLPEDIVSRATLIASAICAGAEGDPLGS